MSRLSLGLIAVALVCLGFPAAGHAAGRLSLSASPRAIEPGDPVTFVLKCGRGRCQLTAKLDRRGAQPRLKGRIRGTLTKTLPPTTKAGTYVARASCGRRSATASFIVHAPAGPDFSLALNPVGKTAKKVRVYRVEATNLAPWPATTARLCVRVSKGGAKVTGVKDGASLRSRSAACALLTRVDGGKARGFAFRVSTSSARAKLQVKATITAANSLRASRTFKGVGAAKASVAHAAQAPSTCTTANKIGVAFVADDSGSMTDNDPVDLRGKAVSVGLDQLPDGSLAGATRFADSWSPLFGVGDLNATSRASMKAAVSSALASAGGTDYEQAFLGAQSQLGQMTAADRRAVIFLSDGLPNDDDYVTDRAIAAAGVPIFTIGFGDADDALLAQIAARSGGQTFAATSADDLQSIFARVVAILTCANPTVRTTLALDPGETQLIPWNVGWDDGEFRALAAWSGGHLTVSAVRPDGSELKTGALRGGEQISDNPTYALLTGTNPAIGGWQLKVASDVGNASTVHVTIDVFKKGLPPLPVHAPIERKSQGRGADPCTEIYGGGTTTSKKIRGGTQRDWDYRASLYSVCGGFGTAEDFEWSLGMKCAFVSATAVLVGGEIADASLQALDTLCTATDTLLELQSGNWAGVAGQYGCELVGSLFAEASGIVVAGLTAETGPGAVLAGTVTYRAFAAGSKLVCGGLLTQVHAWAYNHEDKHEAEVAKDITSHHKCLRETTRLGWINWSAEDCPATGAGGGGGGGGGGGW